MVGVRPAVPPVGEILAGSRDNAGRPAQRAVAPAAPRAYKAAVSKEPALSTVLLIVEMFVTLALIGVVLIQRSEGGGLGIGSSQGMGSFMSGRGTANLLTRMTAILAALFMALALALALLNHGTTGVGGGGILGPGPGPSEPGPAIPARPNGAPVAPNAPASSGSPVAPAPSGSPAAPAPAPTAPTTPAAPAPAPAAPAPAPAPAKPSAPSVPTN